MFEDFKQHLMDLNIPLHTILLNEMCKKTIETITSSLCKAQKVSCWKMECIKLEDKKGLRLCQLAKFSNYVVQKEC